MAEYTEGCKIAGYQKICVHSQSRRLRKGTEIKQEIKWCFNHSKHMPC